MKSKIINMADSTKDAEDRMLESMFAAEPIADEGFSEQIVGKIRRKLWLKRLSLPIAATIGGLVAYEPAVTLANVVTQLVVRVAPQDFLAASFGWLPAPHLIVAGGLMLAVAMVSVRMLED